MPIPGNEEPGELFQQLQQQQQFSNFSGAIPIKKRRFHLVRSPSPSAQEKTCCSEENELKDKIDSNSPDGGLAIGTCKDEGHPCKIEEIKSLELIVRKEQARGTRIELAQDNVDTYYFKPQEADPGTGLGSLDLLPADPGNGLGSLDVLKTEQNMLLNEKSAEPEVSGKWVSAEISNVKQELVGGKIEGTAQLELSTCLDNVGLFIGENKPSSPALEQKISEVIGQMTGKSDLSSLNLASEMLVSHSNDSSTISGVSSLANINRSNWDLNTTMDVWEGSVANQAYVHETAGIDGLRNSKVGHGVKASLRTSLVAGGNLKKGNQVLDEHSSNSLNTSVQHSQLYKPEDTLNLSLSMPCRELDLCGEHSSLSDNMGSESVDSMVKLERSQLPNMNLAFTNVGVIKTELLDENSKLDCSTGDCSTMVLSKPSSVKKDCFVNHSTESVIPQKSVKSELVPEGNKETCESKRAILCQSVAKNVKVMQHQYSTASSSTLSISLTPQNSCPSCMFTCLELPIVGGLLNHCEHSLQLNELQGHMYIPNKQSVGLVAKSVRQSDKHLKLCKTEELSILDAGKYRLASVIENSNVLYGNNELTAENDEKINLSTKMSEDTTFGSDSKSYGNHSTCMDTEEKMHDKEDDEYEDGEVRESLKDSVGEDTRVVELNSEDVVLVESDYQNTTTTVSDKKVILTESNDETICNKNREGAICVDKLKYGDINLRNPLSGNLKEVDSLGKKSVSVITPEKQIDLLGEDVNRSNEIEMSTATNESHSVGVTLDGDAVDKAIDICPVNHNSASSEVKVSADVNNIVNDSSSVAHKSRIIKLPRASIVNTPCKRRSLSSRLLTPQTGKEKYYNLDGQVHPRWTRDELYIDDPNKCVKDRVHGRSFRNSRYNFVRGKGRVFGRFGCLHNEWDSDRDYEAETYNGRADYRVFRRKQSSSISGEFEFNDYSVTPTGASCSGREKKNNEMLSLHRPSLRRLSPGDIDDQTTRSTQMPRRFPRKLRPSRCTVEDGSDLIGRQHDEKFMQHLSGDIRDSIFPRQQTRYDEPDGQLRRNRNFSALHRKGYPRIYLKSPVRSRTRSPGPWSSPRQRSPNGHPDSTQQISPPLFRMGRMRSPEQASCRDEMVPRRRVSPSYMSQHMNDMKEFDFSREHVHPRPISSNRRSPLQRLFPRSTGRSDVLDSRERTDVNEYSNRPGHSDRVQEFCDDESMDERRNLNMRRSFVRPFRSSYDTDSGNYHLHLNDGPKSYRFYQDTDTEFVERSNMREREFDGRIKRPPFSVSRRMKDIEEQQDGSHRPGGRGWHDDGFSDVSGVKRRRF